MHWLVLVISSVFEAIWATALGHTEGFSRLGPTVVFFVTLAISMFGLAWAAKRIAIGTAYAIWTGIVAGLTVGYAFVSRSEESSPWKILFLTGIICGAVGLKLVSTKPSAEEDCTPSS